MPVEPNENTKEAGNFRGLDEYNNAVLVHVLVSFPTGPAKWLSSCHF